MKSLAQYLAENTKKYSFKIWLACVVDKESCDRIKAALEAYKVESFGPPKSLPIQRNNTFFPNAGATEITMIDVTVCYPATPPEVQAKVEECGMPAGCVVVQTMLQHMANAPAANTMGKSILQDQTLDADPAKGLTTTEQLADLLKELESMAIIYAAPKTATAKTTNDLPQGTRSAMGYTKPVLPTAKSIKK